MHRLRIIDRGRDTLRLQRGGEAIAIAALRQADGVLRPHRGAAGGKTRNAHVIAEPLRVTLRHLVTSGDFLLEYLEFFDQDCRLHRVEPAREPEPNIVVFVRALAVNPDAAQRLGEFAILGEDRSAVAKAAEWL